MSVLIKCVKGGVVEPLDFEKLKDRLHEFDFVWVDVKDPVLKELDSLAEIFNFHSLSVESALIANQLSKIEEFSEYVFFTVFEVLFEEKSISSKQLSVFFGKNFIVTVHKNEVDALQSVLVDYEKNPELFREGVVFFLYSVLDKLVDSYFPQLDSLADKIDALENQVFAGGTKQTLDKLFKLKRQIISFRRIVNPQREVLAHLCRHENAFIPKKYLVYFNDVHSHLLRISDITDSYRELVSDALDAYLTVVSNRLNEIMKVLTVIATIMLPLTLVTGFYGMNVDFVEYGVFGMNGTYFFALAMMVVIGVVMLFWFKKKDWI